METSLLPSLNAMSYYEFDANWESFLHVWNTPRVQHSLELDIHLWKEMGFFHTYTKGDPLWKQTKTTYWLSKCVELAKNRSNAERHIHMFKRTMSVVCPRISTTELYYKTCFKMVIRDCEPKPNTIESFIIPEGVFIFKNTMLECARLLFPNNPVGMCMLNGRMITVVSPMNILFDLFGYYFDKYDKNVKYDLSTFTKL